MRAGKIDVDDTYCEAFDGLFTRFVITAKDRKRLERAALSTTALPSTVFGEAEGGVERWLDAAETPDGRPGAIVQLWVNNTKNARSVLEHELGKRVRQGTLVVPTTAIYNALDSDETIDTMNKIGHCGDGYEWIEERSGREVINIPIMAGEFIIERSLGVQKGIMGANLWFFCRTVDDALEVGERALEAAAGVEGIIAPFDICSAGSKPETKFPEIGPSTNHPFCPTLKGKIPDYKVPEGVRSIPEIVLDGMTMDAVSRAMVDAIRAVSGMPGITRVSAGNYGGKLGKHKIWLKDLL